VLHERLYYKESNRKTCNKMPRYNILETVPGRISVSPAKHYKDYVRFEVFTAVTMKNGVFLDVTPCGSCKNRCFVGTYCFLHQGGKNR
jgi:hypothetical protein